LRSNYITEADPVKRDFYGHERRIPHLECQALDRFGHHPWLERRTQEEFFTTLRRWLAEQLVR